MSLLRNLKLYLGYWMKNFSHSSSHQATSSSTFPSQLFQRVGGCDSFRHLGRQTTIWKLKIVQIKSSNPLWTRNTVSWPGTKERERRDLISMCLMPVNHPPNGSAHFSFKKMDSFGRSRCKTEIERIIYHLWTLKDWKARWDGKCYVITLPFHSHFPSFIQEGTFHRISQCNHCRKPRNPTGHL